MAPPPKGGGAPGAALPAGVPRISGREGEQRRSNTPEVHGPRFAGACGGAIGEDVLKSWNTPWTKGGTSRFPPRGGPWAPGDAAAKLPTTVQRQRPPCTLLHHSSQCTPARWLGKQRCQRCGHIAHCPCRCGIPKGTSSPSGVVPTTRGDVPTQGCFAPLRNAQGGKAGLRKEQGCAKRLTPKGRHECPRASPSGSVHGGDGVPTWNVQKYKSLQYPYDNSDSA